MLVQVVDLGLVDGRLDRDRRQGIGCAGGHVARELARRDVEHGRKPADDVAAAAEGARHVPDPELNRGSRHVPDDDPAVTVEDRPARRLLADEPDLVVLGGGQVVVAGEHLQRPEPEEEDPEDDERESAEDSHADRERRRQPVRLTDLGIGRQEPSRAGARLLVCALRQGAPPPPPAGRPSARR